MQHLEPLDRLRAVLDDLDRRSVDEVATDLAGAPTDHPYAYMLGWLRGTARTVLAQHPTD